MRTETVVYHISPCIECGAELGGISPSGIENYQCPDCLRWPVCNDCTRVHEDRCETAQAQAKGE